jgi:hypothetical protein
MDLYRNSIISLRGNNASQHLIDRFATGFSTTIDDIQSILDNNHFCSEIHCVTSKQPFPSVQ